jgi:hypothetical protein
MEFHYGTTRYIPMTDTPATDFIDQDVYVVPAALHKCGATFLAFNGEITDGGEAAYFSLPDGADKAKACIERTLPQGDLRPASPELVKLLRGRKPPALPRPPER